MPSILSLAKEPTQFAGPVISTQENLPEPTPMPTLDDEDF